MAVEFQMPKLGLTMEEGTITAWLVDSGTEVELGTAVLSIETDKVESDVEASHSGILHITGGVGDLFECGERIAWFLEPGEAPPEPGPGNAKPQSPAPSGAEAPAVSRRSPTDPAPTGTGPVSGRDGSRLFASPNARRIAAELGVDLEHVLGSGPGGRIVSEDVRSAPTMTSQQAGTAHATPAAIQTAARLGADLRDVSPGRPGARVDRADVERHVRDVLAGRGPVGAAPAAPPSPPEAPLLQPPTRRIPLTGMRGTIAERMHSSLTRMAQLTLTMDVVMDAVVANRASFEDESRPGYTDYVVAAAARALAEHPVVNSQVADGAVNLLGDINVGVAVALDGGLVVPVVHRADQVRFEDLCAETSRLAVAAREGNLSMTDIEGGTFSVTALGMYGVDTFTPVINPPNTAILGVGRLRDGTRWVDGSPEPVKVLTLSLTWDHRAYDGAPAAEFTAAVRDHLQGWPSA